MSRLTMIAVLLLIVKICVASRHGCGGIVPQKDFNSTMACGTWYLQYVAGRAAGGLKCVEFEFDGSMGDVVNNRPHGKKTRGRDENTQEESVLSDTEKADQLLNEIDDARKEDRTLKRGEQLLEDLTGLTLDLSRMSLDQLKRYLLYITGQKVKITKRDPVVQALDSVTTTEFYYYSDYENYLIMVLCYEDENLVLISSRSPGVLGDIALLDVEVTMLLHDIPMTRDIVPLNCINVH